MPKVVTQRCVEQDLNSRPIDRKSNTPLVAPPRHLCECIIFKHIVITAAILQFCDIYNLSFFSLEIDNYMVVPQWLVPNFSPAVTPKKGAKSALNDGIFI